MAVARIPEMTVAERLSAIQPFADDPHFAVREWAWLSVRSHVIANVAEWIAELTPWTVHQSERLRRFASEVTRSRGVWSAHINELKRDPAAGLPILEPLQDDPSRYVQDSVGNWLNDAAKSRPRWVQSTCEKWTSTEPGPGTHRICRRGLRNITAALEAEAANLRLLTLNPSLPGFASD